MCAVNFFISIFTVRNAMCTCDISLITVLAILFHHLVYINPYSTLYWGSTEAQNYFVNQLSR